MSGERPLFDYEWSADAMGWIGAYCSGDSKRIVSAIAATEFMVDVYFW